MCRRLPSLLVLLRPCCALDQDQESAVAESCSRRRRAWHLLRLAAYDPFTTIALIDCLPGRPHSQPGPRPGRWGSSLRPRIGHEASSQRKRRCRHTSSTRAPKVGMSCSQRSHRPRPPRLLRSPAAALGAPPLHRQPQPRRHLGRGRPPDHVEHVHAGEVDKVSTRLVAH